ncbi:hypothetical protein C9374_011816 [Naegleria lovaniensis]|uniref:F-box domain-containing protein n=1 Tax=Naegleria lovaniensis TaxID=51637 RepID=A0AA88G9E6_NAELO|nr:uncharacterized protein C9374_011816 [Naegleria lovaniensis]KAG2373727.1 hypothetical protein C9374_011816 [Naegleria lovaniensis]
MMKDTLSIQSKEPKSDDNDEPLEIIPMNKFNHPNHNNHPSKKRSLWMQQIPIHHGSSDCFEIKKRKSLFPSHTDEHHEIFIFHPFHDENILFWMLQFLNSEFLMRVCMMVSKQWLEVALKIPLEFNFKRKIFDSSLLYRMVSCRNVKYLKTLILNNNTIGDAIVKSIAESENMKNLTCLGLGNTRIGYKAITALASSEMMKNLKSLDLSLNSLYTESFLILANSSMLTNLTELNLSRLSLTDQIMNILTSSKNTQYLTRLNLYDNQIEDEGLKLIGNSIHLQQHLKYLNLGCNDFTGDGLKLFVSTPVMKNLKELDISKARNCEILEILLDASSCLRHLAALIVSPTMNDDLLKLQQLLPHVRIGNTSLR